MLTLHGHYMDGNRSVNIALTAQMKNAIDREWETFVQKFDKTYLHNEEKDVSLTLRIGPRDQLFSIIV